LGFWRPALDGPALARFFGFFTDFFSLPYDFGFTLQVE
jgi:hypothetical protein